MVAVSVYRLRFTDSFYGLFLRFTDSFYGLFLRLRSLFTVYEVRVPLTEKDSFYGLRVPSRLRKRCECNTWNRWIFTQGILR